MFLGRVRDLVRLHVEGKKYRLRKRIRTRYKVPAQLPKRRERHSGWRDSSNRLTVEHRRRQVAVGSRRHGLRNLGRYLVSPSNPSTPLPSISYVVKEVFAPSPSLFVLRWYD